MCLKPFADLHQGIGSRLFKTSMVVTFSFDIGQIGRHLLNMVKDELA